MKKFSIHTFGCQMNVHDSEKMAGVLKEQGLTPSEWAEDADVIIFNTCSIRAKAEQKFRSELGRLKALKKQKPGLRIVVAGCIAQQRGAAILKKSRHVDFIIGPQNIHRIGEFLDPAKYGSPATALEENPAMAETELPALRNEKGRAWVSIMYGCNNFCTYCIVPYTRGRETSRPSGSIVAEVEGLSRQGCKEVTLLGQNVNSFKSDCGFPGLLEKINAIEGLKRIRFVTSHPRDLSEGLIEAMRSLDKVCEHIHLPVQSGSTRILGLMNRGYSYGDYKLKVDRLREKIPGIAITTDIIAGFPTETEYDHRATISALKEIEYDGIFAFKYSPRPGTKAALMEGQVEEKAGAERLDEILKTQDGITYKKNRALEGSIGEVLVEGQSETDAGKLAGRTRTNKIVNFSPGAALEAGDIVDVEITEGRKHSLMGRRLGAP